MFKHITISSKRAGQNINQKLSLHNRQEIYPSITQSRKHTSQITVPRIDKDSGSAKSLSTLGRTGLERLPTTALLRNLFLGTLFTSPRVLRLGVAVLSGLANARSFLLNPDKNLLLRAVVKPSVYDQFCAGTNRKEVCRTRDAIKSTGYSGIILCYGKEIQVSEANKLRSTGLDNADKAKEIELWRNGNIETLNMVGDGDWLGIKLTGAGYAVTEALMQGREPPAEFNAAIDVICKEALAKNCRLWIDAEQQVLQTAIDRWTIDLMRRHNVHGNVVVYNTLQAYLKESRNKLMHQLALSSREGWTLAIKLVRGAYIANDQREKIHDTKQDTDDSYNGIVHDILTNNVSTAPEHDSSGMKLFLAGHNPDSIRKAFNLIQDLSQQSKLKVLPDFGQLQGMADHLGCKLLQDCDSIEAQVGSQAPSQSAVIPRVYKCLTWGSIQECMQYLVRRIVENTGGADRMRDGTALYFQELKRRLLAR